MRGKTIRFRVDDDEYKELVSISNGNFSDFFRRLLGWSEIGKNSFRVPKLLEAKPAIEKRPPEKIIEKITVTTSPKNKKDIIAGLKGIIADKEKKGPAPITAAPCAVALEEKWDIPKSNTPTTKKEIMELAKKKGFVEPVYDPTVDVS